MIFSLAITVLSSTLEDALCVYTTGAGEMKITVTSEGGSPDPRAYSIAQAAKILGVHKVSVYRRIYEGKLKVLSGFGRLMISERELEKFLNKVEVHTPNKRR
jgi:excisionase family DNA binding protein